MRWRRDARSTARPPGRIELRSRPSRQRQGVLMTRPCGARSPLFRWLRATAITAAMVLAGAAALAARHLTPPPSLASIPPRPAAPDSYAARVVAKLPPYVPQAQVS